MSRSKDVGTKVESTIAEYGRAHLTPHLERRALAGAKDLGDFAGCPGWVGEAKAGKRYAIPAWLNELDAEVDNADAMMGTLIVKPVGVGLSRPGDFWAIKRLSAEFRLLRMAGFGSPLE